MATGAKEFVVRPNEEVVSSLLDDEAPKGSRGSRRRSSRYVRDESGKPGGSRRELTSECAACVKIECPADPDAGDPNSDCVRKIALACALATAVAVARVASMAGVINEPSGLCLDTDLIIDVKSGEEIQPKRYLLCD